MSNNILITYEQLSHASQQLRNQNQNIQGVLNSLQNEVTNLESGFRGQAHDAYVQYFNEWKNAAAKLNEALNGLATLTDRAASEFQNADSQIANLFRN